MDPAGSGQSMMRGEIGMVQETATGRSWGACLAMVLLATLAGVGRAQAQTVTTIGGSIHYALQTTVIALTGVIVVVFFLIGVWLVISGLAGMIGSRGQTNVTGGIFKIGGGSILVSLPLALGIDVATLFGDGSNPYVGGGNDAVGAPQICLSASGAGGASNFPTTCVLHNIAINVVPVAVETAFIVCYIIALLVAGSVFIGLARSRRSNGVDEPKHWQLKLAVAGIMANIPVFLGDVAATLGWQSVVTGSGYQGISGGTVNSVLAYAAPAGSTLLQKYAETIQWALVVLSMFGVIYAIYGVALMLNVEQRNHSTAKAWVHVLGGVALANIWVVIKLAESTMFGQSGFI